MICHNAALCRKTPLCLSFLHKTWGVLVNSDQIGSLASEICRHKRQKRVISAWIRLRGMPVAGCDLPGVLPLAKRDWRYILTAKTHDRPDTASAVVKQNNRRARPAAKRQKCRLTRAERHIQGIVKTIFLPFLLAVSGGSECVNNYLLMASPPRQTERQLLLFK